MSVRTLIITAAVTSRVRTTLLRTGPAGADGADGADAELPYLVVPYGDPNGPGDMTVTAAPSNTLLNQNTTPVTVPVSIPRVADDSFGNARWRLDAATVCENNVTDFTLALGSGYYAVGTIAATPDLATWSVIGGSGTPLVTLAAPLAGEYYGQLCQSPGGWWTWDAVNGLWLEANTDALANVEEIQAALTDTDTLLVRDVSASRTRTSLLSRVWEYILAKTLASPITLFNALGFGATGRSLAGAATQSAAQSFMGLDAVLADHLLSPVMVMGWNRVLAAVTGSGNSDGLAGIYYGVTTNTTPGSTARVDNNASPGEPWFLGGYGSTPFSATDKFIVNGVFLRISNTSTGVWRFGLGKSHGGAVGQWTEAGFGFVCKNMRLWAFTHNGTTYTETDTGVDIPGGEVPMQFCVHRTATEYQFYLNRVLVVTRVIAGYSHFRFVRIEAENGANAATQRMRISCVNFRFL